MKKMLETKKLALMQLILSAIMMVFVVMHWVYSKKVNINIYSFKGIDFELALINIFLIVLSVIVSVIGGFQIYVAFEIERDKTYKIAGALSGITQLLSTIPYVHGFATAFSFILNVLIYLDVIKPKDLKADEKPKVEEKSEPK